MWKTDGALIQVELGSGVIKSFTSKDSRGFFDNLFGTPPPSDGNLIVDYTRQFREYILKNEGLNIPPISYRDNDSLKFNEVLIYFGLETELFEVSDSTEMFNFIANKLRSYISLAESKSCDSNNWIMEAIDNVKVGNYQDATKIYSLVYYSCYLANNSFEMIKCLSDAGGVMLMNGDIDKSHAFFLKATQLCSNPSIVDPVIKIQVGINFASTLKILGASDIALSSYKSVANIALYSGNYPLLFIALIGLAEMQFTTGKYPDAIYTLEQADLLLFSDEKNPNYKISRNIHKSISEIKSVIIHIMSQKLQQLQNQAAKDKAKTFFTEAFKEIGIVIAKLGIQYFSCKIFGIKGGTVGMSLIGIFSIKDSSFTQSQFGDNNVINNLEGVVNS